MQDTFKVSDVPMVGKSEKEITRNPYIQNQSHALEFRNGNIDRFRTVHTPYAKSPCHYLRLLS